MLIIGVLCYVKLQRHEEAVVHAANIASQTTARDIINADVTLTSGFNVSISYDPSISIPMKIITVNYDCTPDDFSSY